MKVKVEMNIDLDMTEEELNELSVLEIRDIVSELIDEESAKSYDVDINVKRVERTDEFTPLN
ncbi:MAG: hypothetical protein ACOCZ5_02880 [bacterium]